MIVLGNMAHCRFINTVDDLRTCQEALDDNEFDSLSDSEKQAAIRLVEICGQILDEHENIIE